MRIAALLAALFLAASAGSAARAQSSPLESPPTLALDHFWIATAPSASEERAALEAAGFRISPVVNRHEGQGTASQTVEFENGYLELIYVDDGVLTAGEGGAAARQRFFERAHWRDANISPFGVALTRTPSTPATFPFETWRVTADWMPAGAFMEMLTPRDSRATNIAVHPAGVDAAANRRLIAQGGEAAWPFRHPNGARRITNLVILAADRDGQPPSARFVNESGADVSLQVGHEWLAVLTLDNGAQHQRVDLRPKLPLIVHY